MTNAPNTTQRRYWPWVAGFIGLSLLSLLPWPLLVLFLVGSLIVWGVRRWQGNTESFIDMSKNMFPPKTTAAKPPTQTAATAATPAVASVTAPAAVPPPDEIRLGTDTSNGKATGVYLDELGQHALLLGATGSGKTTTLLKITNGAAALGIPVVAIDLKGSRGFGDRLRQTANRHGRGFALVAVWHHALEPARSRRRVRAQGQARRDGGMVRASLQARC